MKYIVELVQEDNVDYDDFLTAVEITLDDFYDDYGDLVEACSRHPKVKEWCDCGCIIATVYEA